MSQQIAIKLLEYDVLYLQEHGISWIQGKIRSLDRIREEVWKVILKMGTVKTFGAFYFLIPIPTEVINKINFVSLRLNPYE